MRITPMTTLASLPSTVAENQPSAPFATKHTTARQCLPAHSADTSVIAVTVPAPVMGEELEESR